MNILFITPQFPYPLRQGTTLRNFNVIQHLARRHTIDLLTFFPPDQQPPTASPLHQICRHIHTVAQPDRTSSQRVRDTVRSPLPDMALRLESSEMRDRVRAWVLSPETRHAYDVVQIEGIEVAQYGLMILDDAQSSHAPGHGGHPRVYFDNHNCEYLLQKRNALNDLRQPKRWAAAAYSLVQWQKLRRYEQRICRAVAGVSAVSPNDQAALQELAPQARITVIPNGIDLATYDEPVPAENPAEQNAEQNDVSDFTLVFVGKMDYRPNVDAALWFGQQVLPAIHQEMPNVRFQIVGQSPHPRLDVLRNQPSIEITGAVEDVRPYIHAAAVYVIPLRVGGGTRFKALEAMACRKAIVSTRLGIEGISAQHEHELLLADSPAEFASEVVRVLRAPALSDELGRNAREFVAAHYQWKQIIPRFEELYSAQRTPA